MMCLYLSYTNNMNSLLELLNKRDLPAEPAEIKLIKDYVRAEFQTEVEVMVRDKDIVIIVDSAALANTLRLRGPKIKRICQTDKKLNFRID